MSWRFTVWVSEVGRNLRARAAIWLVVGGVAALTFGAVTGAELSEGAAAVELRHNLDIAGSNIVVIAAPGQGSAGSGSLDTGRCLGLNGRVGVVRAGSERVVESTEILSAPGLPVLQVEVAGPTIAIWDPALQNSSVTGRIWVTDTLRERYGVSPGQQIHTSNSTTPLVVFGTFSPVRIPTMGARIVYSGNPAEPADRCWVEVTSPLTQDKLIALASWFANDAPIVVRPLLAPDQLRADPKQQFDARTNRYSWIVAGALIGGAWALLARIRRPELALLMSIGAGRVTAVALLTAEMLAVGVAAWLIGTGTALTVWTMTEPLLNQTPSTVSLATTASLLALFLGLTIGSVAALMATLGSRLQALKARE